MGFQKNSRMEKLSLRLLYIFVYRLIPDASARGLAIRKTLILQSKRLPKNSAIPPRFLCELPNLSFLYIPIFIIVIIILMMSVMPSFFIITVSFRIDRSGFFEYFFKLTFIEPYSHFTVLKKIRQNVYADLLLLCEFVNSIDDEIQIGMHPAVHNGKCGKVVEELKNITSCPKFR